MIEIIPNWHPIFVHFTVALLSVSLGLFIVGLVGKCDQAILVAKWNLWIGAGISLLTLAAGIYAYNTVAHDTPSHAAMTEHRNWALATLVLLVPLVVWSVVAHRKAKSLGLGFIVLFVVVGGLLASTAWHGGEVVYRYGLGVISLPKVDSHDHGSDAAHGHDDVGTHHEHDVETEMEMDEMDFSGMEFNNVEMEASSGNSHSHDDEDEHHH